MDVKGPYLMKFTEQPGGTCGAAAIDGSVVQLSGGLPIKAHVPICPLDAPAMVENGGCKITAKAHCADSSGVVLERVVSTIQVEPDGGMIVATEATTEFDAAGNTTCTSTYDVEATRQ